MAGTKWSLIGKGFNLDSIIEANEKGKPGSEKGKSGSVPTIVFPVVTTTEDEEKIVLRLEVPGFRREDLHVCRVGDAVQVRGEVEAGSGGDEQVRREQGIFVRSFVLPEQVDESGVRTSYEAGVLMVVMPKRGNISQAA